MTGEITILANPGHGNGPTVGLLMAAEAVQNVSGQPVNVIFPYMGKGQRDVIGRRRDPRRNVRIYFDHTLGALLYPVTLRQNDYRQNVADIVAYQAPVQNLARQYIAGGLTTVDFSGQPRRFQTSELSFELNHGSRVRMLDAAFYFFPCLLSDLLKHSTDIDEDERQKALAIVEQLEAGYRTIFLPKIHTFSWDTNWQPPTQISFTPFPRPPARGIPAVTTRGIYIMPSGVGTAADPAIAQVAIAIRDKILKRRGYPPTIYCPPGSHIALLPDAVELSPQAIAHPNVELVIGRAGWGTLWESLNAEKPFIAIPALPGDDPEILFNLRTLADRNLGIIWIEQKDILTELDVVRHEIADCLKTLENEYGTRDGLDTMARTILSHV